MWRIVAPAGVGPAQNLVTEHCCQNCEIQAIMTTTSHTQHSICQSSYGCAVSGVYTEETRQTHIVESKDNHDYRHAQIKFPQDPPFKIITGTRCMTECAGGHLVARASGLRIIESRHPLKDKDRS